jgi:hypothetical protein
MLLPTLRPETVTGLTRALTLQPVLSGAHPERHGASGNALLVDPTDDEALRLAYFRDVALRVRLVPPSRPGAGI